MNSKQNIVFFIGVILIVMVFWLNGYWTILHDGIFTKMPNVPHTKTLKPGQCPKGFIWDPKTKKCLQELT